MKEIKITLANGGKSTIEIISEGDLLIHSENEATKLTLDFTNVTNNTYIKWVDFLNSQKTNFRYNLGTDPIVEMELNAALMIKGDLTIAPFMTLDETPSTVKIPYKQQVVTIKKQINAGDVENVIRDDYIFELAQRIEECCNGGGEDMDVRIIESIPLDVNIQDQTSPVVIGKVSKLKFEGTTTSEATIDTRTVDVAPGDISNFEVGDYVTIFNIPANRFYQGKVTDVTANTITLDTPLDFTFVSGSFITSATTNLAVDGSIALEKFGVRNTVNRIPSKVDITRIIFTMTLTGDPDLSLFGNLSPLDNGLVIRRNDGVITNYFNVKTNKELAALLYDLQMYNEGFFGAGQAGLIARLTFGGQSKIGVVVRLEEDDDFEVLIQDNLTNITLFEITVEGHIVVD